MRTAFIETLSELAALDERIWLLTGDLGYSVLEKFSSGFPDRYVNVGVAEQNMSGVATGLAMCGKIVFTYSIANFPTLRCLEQIRNDLCYHNANVKVVAVGGGLVYGAHGVSHHATEDLAIMRALPNMTVIAPGDPVETALATRSIVEWPGPCYLRLGKAGEPNVHDTHPDFKIGKAIKLQNGSDVTLIVTGGLLYNTMQAAKLLTAQGIHVRTLSMHTIKPLDSEAIIEAARETKILFTIEEHNIIGGLGSAVAEILAESKGMNPITLRRIGLKDSFCREIGNLEYLRNLKELSIEFIVKTVKTFLRPLW